MPPEETGVGLAGTPPADAQGQAPAQDAQTPPDASAAPQSDPQQTPDAQPDPSWLAPRLQREREATERRLQEQYAGERELAEYLRSKGVDPRAAVQAAREQQEAAEAEAAGVPAPVWQQMTAMQRELAELKAQQQTNALTQQEADLTRTHPDYGQHRDQARALAAKHGLPLEDAYFLATRGAQGERTRREAEQAAIANVTGRDGKGTERVDSRGAPPQKPNIGDRSAVPDEEIERIARSVMGRR